MMTLIRVENANCTYCMNDVRDELLARPLVHNVRTSMIAGCLEIDHDYDDITTLTALVRQNLHGWAVADNGEIIMVTTSPEPSESCPRHLLGQPHRR